MNIGYLVRFRWFPPSGGGTVHAYQVAKQLMDRGHRLKTIRYWHDAPGLHVYRRRELLRFLRDIDILYMRTHGNWTYEHWMWLKALRLFRRPVVWEINSPFEELVERNMKTRAEVERMNAKRKFFSRWVDKAICVSSTMEEYARDFLKIKDTAVIPNGSDPDQFHPDKRSDDVYSGLEGKFKVLWSGSADYSWQGVTFLSDIAKQVGRLDKNVQFVVLTDMKHIRDGQLQGENISVIDRRPYLEVAPYFASADLGLSLYRPYGWNEKFYFSPLKLFDYMASGLPVIASNQGQMSEVITDGVNGLLTNNNVEDVAKKIVALRNDRERASSLGEEARKEIERYFNWRRVGKETEDVLMPLVEKQRSRSAPPETHRTRPS
jgi:glycosyltransferase involved in cell wall biosynthesis